MIRGAKEFSDMKREELFKESETRYQELAEIRQQIKVEDRE
jgi:ribosomal protein L29